MTKPISPLLSSTTDAPPDADRVKAAAEQFEGFFIGQLLRQMRSSTRELSGEDQGSNLDADMLDMADVALGNSLAGQHAFGIADAILRQLLPSPSGAESGPAAGTATELKVETIPVASR